MSTSAVRDRRRRRFTVASLLVVVAGTLFALAVPAGAQPPPPPPSKHCVSDRTDSYLQGTDYGKTDNFVASACEYRSGRSMNVGLTWNVPTRHTHFRSGIEGGSVLFFQIWDCTTGKVVLNGVHNFPTYGKFYRLSGSGNSGTFVARSGHSYRARITGTVMYQDGDGFRYEMSEYPPTHVGIGALNSFSRCYSS